MPPRRDVAVRREEGPPRRARPPRLRGAAASRPPSRSQVTSSGTCTVTSLRLRFVTSGGILSRVQSSPRSFAPARRPHRHRVRGAPRGSAPPRSPRRAAWTAGCAETKDLYADPAASPSPRWAVLTPKLPASKEKPRGKTLGPYTLHTGERRRPSSTTAVLADKVQPELQGGRLQASPPHNPHLDIPHISPGLRGYPPSFLLESALRQLYSYAVGGLQGVHQPASTTSVTP